MADSEDVYDVAQREPGHMVCLNCNAVFLQWEEIDDDMWVEDENCPSCGQAITRNKEV